MWNYFKFGALSGSGVDKIKDFLRGKNKTHKNPINGNVLVKSIRVENPFGLNGYTHFQELKLV